MQQILQGKLQSVNLAKGFIFEESLNFPIFVNVTVITAESVKATKTVRDIV